MEPSGPNNNQLFRRPNEPIVLGRNRYGDTVMTSSPTNESELQLYKLLQKANLLKYFDTFISHGGDDVQQLYDAEEEEFLEIMQMVGMIAKPLHVRRFQKALLEWYKEKGQNQAQLLAPPIDPCSAQPMISRSSIQPIPSTSNLNNSPILPNSLIQQVAKPIAYLPNVSNVSNLPNVPPILPTTAVSLASNAPITTTSLCISPLPKESQTIKSQSSASILQLNTKPIPISTTSTINGPNLVVNSVNVCANNLSNANSNIDYLQASSPISMTNTLVDHEIQKLSEAAVKVIAVTSLDEIKKKKNIKEVEHVINMDDDDPRRLNEIRRYAPIYGRFDCKRKPEKPLSLHEAYVNEAAFQLCKLNPLLLVNRNELFRLSRETVKLSGYPFSKGHSRSQSNLSFSDLSANLNSNSNSCGNSDHNNAESNETSNHETDTKENNGNNSLENHLKSNQINESNSNSINSNNTLTNNTANNKENSQKTSRVLIRKDVKEDSLVRSCAFEEERKRKLDRIEKINEIIQYQNNECEKLKAQLKIAHENGVANLVLQLKNDLDSLATKQMELINEQSEINKQFRKIDRLNSSQQFVNFKFSSDSDENDDTDSQLSIYSNCSSKEEFITKLHSPSQLKETTSSQNSIEFHRTVSHKRKSIDNSTPIKNKLHITEQTLKKLSSKTINIDLDNEDTEIEQDDDEEAIGIDLRIGHSSKNDLNNSNN